MSEYIVEMKHITKRFGSVTANEDVTLQVKKGEILALLGENGAGKSTLMSMLFGMYEPDEGEIFVRGRRERISSPRYAAGLNIGMVHQHFKLVEDYTVTENMILGMEPKKRLFGLLPMVDLKGAEKRTTELSKAYGLKVVGHQVAGNADVSTRQRIEILKMLYREAEILIFDEPTAVLAPQEIQYLLDIIKGLRDSGKTILLITHKLEEIRQAADRCAILCQGRLKGVFPVEGLSVRHMAKLMVGREVSFSLEKKPAVMKGTILDVSHLKVYGRNGHQAVKDVSFQVHGGEIFAIAGVSGNGQIEIADAIAGLLPAKGGTVKLCGVGMENMTVRERCEAGVAYIPEDRHSTGLIMDFTLEENLGLKSYYREPFSKNGVLKKTLFASHAEGLIRDYDIKCSDGGHTIVRSMSGGNQQKAIIARETERESSLLIFVQPTRGLDIGAAGRIHRLMLEIRDSGKGILLISFEMDEILECADTIGVIYNGRLLKTGSAKDFGREELGAYMIGEKGGCKSERMEGQDGWK